MEGKDWIKKEIKAVEKNKCIAICLCLDATNKWFSILDKKTDYDARKYGKRTNPISPDPSKALIL